MREASSDMSEKKPVYTRKGDKGKTSLLSGERIDKDSIRVEAYGTVDELITVLGIAKVHSNDKLIEYIHAIQQRLFHLAAELATPLEDPSSDDILAILNRIGDVDVINLESIADKLTEQLPSLANFVIPGGTKAAAFLHHARTVCRRAERRVITLSNSEDVRPEIIRYLNRLSDTLFVLARYANFEEGEDDILISSECVSEQKKGH
jgi:cob(I)alamin adenosyltransferase